MAHDQTQWLGEKLLGRRANTETSVDQRKAYDTRVDGEAARTVFTSKAEVVTMLKNVGFENVHVERKNSDEYYRRGRLVISREQGLKWIAPYSVLISM